MGIGYPGRGKLFVCGMFEERVMNMKLEDNITSDSRSFIHGMAKCLSNESAGEETAPGSR